MPCVQSKDLMKSHWMIFKRDNAKYRDWIYIIHYRRRSSYFFIKNGMVSQYKKNTIFGKRILRVNFHLTKMKRSPLRLLLIKKANSGFTMEKGNIISIFGKIFPTIYFIGTNRNLKQIQDDLFYVTGRQFA